MPSFHPKRDIFNYLYKDDPHNRRIIKVLGTLNKTSDRHAIKSSLRGLFRNIIFEYRKVFVLTDGTNSGVSRLVGEIFNEEFYGNENIKLIGVNKLKKMFPENELKQLESLEVRIQFDFSRLLL